MNLDEYIKNFLGEIISKEGLKKIKNSIQEDIKASSLNYNQIEIENIVVSEELDYESEMKVSNELYEDCGIIYIDYYVEI